MILVSWHCQLFSVFIKFCFAAEMLSRIAFLGLTDLVSHRLEVIGVMITLYQKKRGALEAPRALK